MISGLNRKRIGGPKNNIHFWTQQGWLSAPISINQKKTRHFEGLFPHFRISSKKFSIWGQIINSTSEKA